MYEVWLVLNVVWEIALDVWPVLLAVAVLWFAVMGWVLSRPVRRWRAALGGALGVGLLVGAAAVLGVPAWSRSSLGEMGYWVDWANLLAIAAGFGAVAIAFAWPLLAGRMRPAAAGGGAVS